MAICGLLLLVFASIAASAPASVPSSEVLENEASGGPDLRALRRILTLLSPAQCKKPFKAFDGLCLLWNSNVRRWSDAEKTCRALGGHLAWIDNADEHEVIGKFVSKKFPYWYWIGLHRRDSNGTFVWSSLSDSDYRGAIFLHKERPFVAAHSGHRILAGCSESTLCPFVCRQKTGEAAPLNILSLLQRVKDQTQTQCPYPWAENQGVCLLYFYTQHTWREAEDLCFSKDGALVWIESKEEHAIIKWTGWTRKRKLYSEYWIGLHKDQFGDLEWSGGFSASSYRGSPFEKGKASYFYSRFKTEKISGAEDGERKSIVCRRPL